jgi:hypothetical protein
MGQPTSRMVHIDQPLTQLSVAYRQSRDVFVAERVFPNVNVDKQSNKYFTFDKQAFFRDSAQRRSNGEESAGSGLQGLDRFVLLRRVCAAQGHRRLRPCQHG